MLFSIGNVKPLFKQVFADCWKSHSTCNANWLHAVEYLEIVGIIVGQVIVGFLGDWYVETTKKKKKKKEGEGEICRQCKMQRITDR